MSSLTTTSAGTSANLMWSHKERSVRVWIWARHWQLKSTLTKDKSLEETSEEVSVDAQLRH